MKYFNITRAVFILATVFIVAGCLDPYAPPIADQGVDYLVVDGFLNSGNKSVSVTLSTALPLNTATNVTSPLIGATVQIEGEDGTTFNVPETSNGLYTASAINVQTGKRYQLRIKTPKKEYLSSYVELKKSPVLDDVTWGADEKGVTIYVDSHDETASTKYYQWAFTETYEYTSDQLSSFHWNKKTAQVTPRLPEELVYVCYKSQNSTRVLISATTQNSADVVNDFPLAFITKGSQKLSRLYSILVQQRALDADAYNYWKNIQKTTENLGGLFDPLPSQVNSNVRNVNDPLENVLGYFAGGEVQEKRLFIDQRELPENLRTVDKPYCKVDSILIAQLPLYTNKDLYVINGYGVPFTIGYTVTTDICADCSKSGGILQKPEYWPLR